MSDVARTLIADMGTKVLISPASYWEIAIKVSRGKFIVDVPYDDFWRKGIEANDIGILPIELRHTSKLTSLPWHHKDPFDRLLAAQALVEQIPLLSADATFDAYGVQRIH